MRLLEPAEFLAVGTVGEYAGKVAADSPVDQRVDLIEKRVGALERADLLGRVGRVQPGQLDDLGQAVRIGLALGHRTLDFHVAETVVGELRLPAFDAAVAARRVAEEHRSARRTLVDRAVGAAELAGKHPHGMPVRSAHAQADDARGVLPQIVQVVAFRVAIFADGRNPLADLDRRRALRAQRGVEPREHGGAPRTVVEVRRGPAGLRKARIVILASVNARERDRPRRRLPRVVRDDRLSRAVFVLDLQLEDHLRRSVRSGELAVPLARDVEKSVAEHRADRVGALPKPVAHVERNVLHLLIELGPGRIEEVVARLLAVEKQFELAQSADIGRRPPHGLVDRELAAQQRQLVPPERLVAQDRVVGTRVERAVDDDQRVDVLLERDPPRPGPVFAVGQPHRETLRRTPRRRLAVRSPDADAPIIGFGRFQRLPVIRYQQRLFAGNLAAVPHRSTAGSGVLFRSGHDDAVGGLPASAFGRYQLPTETGRRSFDSDRIGLLLALERAEAGAGLRRERRAGYCHERQPQGCPTRKGRFFHRFGLLVRG